MNPRYVIRMQVTDPDTWLYMCRESDGSTTWCGSTSDPALVICDDESDAEAERVFWLLKHPDAQDSDLAVAKIRP